MDHTHDEVQNLLGIYALDATEADETALVERHLARCPRCRGELDARRTMVAALGNRNDPVPDGLWDRIAREVASSRDLHGPGPTPELVVTPLVAVRSSNRQWSSPMVRAAAVASVAAVTIVVVLGLNWSGARHDADRAHSAAVVGRDAADVRVALATPGRQVVALRSPRGTVLARFVVMPDGTGYLMSSVMPALPDDKTYQLWAIIDGRPISLALLGHQVGRATFTEAGATPTSLTVTVEPSGGRTSPDRSPVAEGSLTRT